MRFTDFIMELDKAGWEGVRDAQHSFILELHKKLFPVVAELEEENVDLSEDLLAQLEEKGDE